MQISLYTQAYSAWGFSPNMAWTPSPSTVDGQRVEFINIAGVIFYTDDKKLKQELAMATSFAVASALVKRRALLAATRLGAEAVLTAAINRGLATIAAVNSSRMMVTVTVSPLMRF
ncbi:MAG: hypothetical protein IPH76_17985 [Xanthomonadales bacterium]|nr:hypothetical protein [Xanthomonadales bacterium]